MDLTLEQFKKSKRVVDKSMVDVYFPEMDGGENVKQVYEYDHGCYIFELGPDRYHLIIGYYEWFSNDLSSLEDLLYHRWYVS